MCQAEANDVEPKNWGRIVSRQFGRSTLGITRKMPCASHPREPREG